MIIVDTSVLIDFLRGADLPGAKRLRQLEETETPFAIPAICCQEVLQGAKDHREWRLLVEHFETQALLFPLNPWSHHVEAAKINFDCRRKGITIRSSIDFYIAQLVLDEDGVLLHNDQDFDLLRKVRPLRTARS